MKKNFLLFGIFVVISAYAQEEVLHPKLDSIAKGHKSIAILPFEVAFNYRPVEQKQLKPGDLESLQKREGLMMQKALDAYFFKRTSKKDISIHVQETDSTNMVLKTKRVKIDPFDSTALKKIALALGVDAILFGTFDANRPVSKEVARAFTFITGFPLTNITGRCVIYMFDGRSGELLWSRKKSFSQGPNSDIDDIIIPAMKNLSKKLPYKD